jgi:Flp pilus assembly protein TadG
MGRRRRDESAAAVVDFVLIMVILVPLVLGIVQVGLVLHVRNTLAAAASDGARYGAGVDHSPGDGARRTRDLIDGALASRYAEDVSAAATEVDGYPGVEVRVRAEVPALGLFGPAVSLDVEGHAVDEVLP